MPTVRNSPNSLSRPVSPTFRLLTARMTPPTARPTISATPSPPRAGSLASATPGAVMSLVPRPSSLVSRTRNPFAPPQAPAPFVMLDYRRPPTPIVAAPVAAPAPHPAPTPDTAVTPAQARQPRLLLGGE